MVGLAACLGDDPVVAAPSDAGSAAESSAPRPDDPNDAEKREDASAIDGGPRFDAAWTRCAGNAFACEDFDDAGPTLGWILDADGDGGTSSIVASASSPSSPNVMDITAPPGTRVYLTFGGALQGGGLDCSFAMKINAASQVEALLAQLVIRSGGSSFTEITLHSQSVSMSTSLADAGAGPFAMAPLVLPALGTWFRVNVSTRLTGRTFLSINDDPPVLEATNTATETSAGGLLAVGVSVFPGAAPAWMVSVDNLLCVRAP